jgi:23S rRNA pseudouridine2605 synthase
MEERLQKILAKAGISSRRKAEELIQQGMVSIDGKIVTDMGIKLDPQHHQITVNGKTVATPEQKVYFLLNKPAGYVTTVNDPQNRPIVTSLLKDVQQRVFPVGRLDLNTEGALLLTNDGDLANRILHPRNEVTKTYVAEVSGHPSSKDISLLEKGIEIEGKKTWPARIKLLDRTKNASKYQLTIHEGRKRQIRKMFTAIGFPVITLKRIAYGRLKLENLKTGQYRPLSQKDIQQIFLEKKSLYNR